MACLYRTFRKDCEAVINFCASEDGRALVVNRFIDEHNREVNMVHCLHENTNMISIILVGFFCLFWLRNYSANCHNKESLPMKRRRKLNNYLS